MISYLLIDGAREFSLVEGATMPLPNVLPRIGEKVVVNDVGYRVEDVVHLLASHPQVEGVFARRVVVRMRREG